MISRVAFAAVAWLFLACVVIQVFLAGLGVFAGSSYFELHRNFGYIFGLLTVVMVVIAAIGRLGRRLIGLSALLVLLFTLQSVFIAFREGLPAAAALHPVNALAIFWVAQLVARDALQLARADSGPRGEAEPART